jgi:hypothetical protein
LICFGVLERTKKYFKKISSNVWRYKISSYLCSVLKRKKQ